MSKKVWVAGLIVVLFVAGAFLHRTYKERHADAGTIKIGVAVAQTGMAAQWGEGEYNVIRMLVDEQNAKGGIDGKQIELAVEDTRSDANGTTNAILKLATVDNVAIVIGPTWGDVFQGGYPIAQEHNIVLLSPSTALESVLNRQELTYLFSTWWPQSVEVDAFIKYAQAHSKQKIAVINDQGSFSMAFAADVVRAVEANPPLTLVDHLEMPVGSQDFRTGILKVHDAKPDLVYLLLEDDSNYGPLIKQAKELNLKLQFFSMTSAQNESLLKNFAAAVEGLIYTYPHIDATNEYNALINSYTARYGAAPATPSFSNTINATRAAFAALESGARTGPQLREALTKVSVPGVGVSTIHFTDGRQVDSASFDIKTIKNGAFMFVE